VASLAIAFLLRGREGEVRVEVAENGDPDAVGYALLTGGQATEFARGFPICRATVAYPGAGYAAVFGWTQMVCSSDAGSGFEMDPIALYRDLATPFAWFGVKPELFDAPSRRTRDDMTWEAHSFLCITPDAVLSRRVQPICGFSWGFAIRESMVRLAPLQVLSSTTWKGHLELLRQSYPGWIFDESYAEA
jgi:hypothetical protein